jgi:hypothetical protein
MGTPLDDCEISFITFVPLLFEELPFVVFHLASPALANSKISDQVEWDFVLGGDDAGMSLSRLPHTVRPFHELHLADNLLRGPLFQDVDGDFGLQTVLTQGSVFHNP